MLYLFEDFSLDSDRHELRRGAALLSVEPQVLDLLVFLVANHHRVVSKDDLLASVWGGRIVSESAVFSRINAVRRAVGDSGKEQRLIRTIIGKGVRYIGEVRRRQSCGERVTPATLPRLSIVVLPFTNISNDAQLEYLADGITNDLTTDLSRISGNFVIARNTALSLKGQSVDVRRLGTELGVRYVLEGSIRRAGDRVRLNPQLTDAETGAQLWADRFDTNCANVTENHDELTGRLARTLEVELMRAAAQRIDQDQAAEPNASDFVLRGRACRYRPSSPANRREALRNFERALELDAGSAEAKIGIASTLAADLADGWSRAPCRDMARAETLLLEALETGSNSAQAQLAIGLLRRLQKRFDEAGIALNAAIGFDRNNAGAFFQLGLTAMLTGRPEAAIPPIDRAIRLNPNDPVAANRYWGLGVCHLLLGQTDRALELMIRARAENPRLWYVHLDLAAALGLTGAVDAARAALAEAIELKPEVSSLRWLRAHPAGGNARYWALYEKSGAAGLRRVGTPET